MPLQPQHVDTFFNIAILTLDFHIPTHGFIFIHAIGQGTGNESPDAELGDIGKFLLSFEVLSSIFDSLS